MSGTATIGTLISGSGSINLLSSSTANLNTLGVTGATTLQGGLSVSGTADILGNSMYFASWLSNPSMPGIAITYNDATSTPTVTPSLLKWTATQPLHEWLWEHNTADQSSTVPMMKLDSSHVLTIYDTTGNPAIVLDPSGTVSMNGGNLLTQTAADALYLPANAGLSASNGNIGIGTANPQAKLDVAGNLSVHSGSSSALFVNATTGGVGLGTNNPTHALTFSSSSTGIALYNTSDQITDYERVHLYWSANAFNINTENAGAGSARSLSLFSGSSIRLNGNGAILDVSQNASNKFNFNFTNTTLPGPVTNFTGTLGASNATQAMCGISPTINQSGTAGYTALLINPTQNTIGSGSKNLIEAQVNGTDKFTVDNYGDGSFLGNVGIGTSSPVAHLQVTGGWAYPVIAMPDSTHSKYSTGFGCVNVSGVGQRLDFYTGNSGTDGVNLNSNFIRMSLTANGLLGIGTTTPQATLDVNGSAKIAGNLAISGSGSLTLPDGTVLSGSNTLKSVMTSGTALTISGSVSASQVAGLSTVATTGNYSSLAGLPRALQIQQKLKIRPFGRRKKQIICFSAKRCRSGMSTTTVRRSLYSRNIGRHFQTARGLERPSFTWAVNHSLAATGREPNTRLNRFLQIKRRDRIYGKRQSFGGACCITNKES